MATAQREAGASVTVATMQHSHTAHSVIGELRDAGVDVMTAGRGRGPLLHSPHVRRLTAITADHDVIHVHGVWEHIVTAFLRSAVRAGRPSILRPCGMLTQWSLARHPLRKRVLWRIRAGSAAASARMIHFSSEQERDETTLLPRDGQDWFVEPNGIVAESFTGGNGATFRRRFAIPDTDRIVLFIGRLHPGKGIENLIRAFSVFSSADDAILVIAGPPDTPAYGGELDRIARESGAAARIRFIGPVSQSLRNDALASADVFALVSDHESFGNSALEALAAGVPALVSDRVPLSHHIVAHDCGVVCRTDTASVSRGLDTLLQRSRADREIGTRARACAAEFEWRRVASRIMNRYGSLL
jgi:glycosyltransferase involved in cell wall biosynthesis